LADFHSAGKIPLIRDSLNIRVRDSASRSRHSHRSFAEMLSNPVAFDLQSLTSSAKTCVGVVFSKTKYLSVFLRNSTKDLSTSVTSLLRLGPISMKKEIHVYAISVSPLEFAPSYSIS